MLKKIIDWFCGSSEDELDTFEADLFRTSIKMADALHDLMQPGARTAAEREAGRVAYAEFANLVWDE